MNDHETAGMFERLKKGLGESISHSRGELTLKTTVLPSPPPAASARRVARLRKRLRMSQAVFAATLNVSPKLVQSWEQGVRMPRRGDLRLIQIIEKDPEIVESLFAPALERSGRD